MSKFRVATESQTWRLSAKVFLSRRLSQYLTRFLPQLYRWHLSQPFSCAPRATSVTKIDTPPSSKHIIMSDQDTDMAGHLAKMDHSEVHYFNRCGMTGRADEEFMLIFTSYNHHGIHEEMLVSTSLLDNHSVGRR